VGKPINDTHMLQSLNRTATLWHDLETMKIPGIQAVYVPAESTGWFWAIVSVETMYPGHSNHVANAVMATTTGHHGTKGIIIVDKDIAVDNWADVFWALSVRFDPKRSAQIIDRGRSSPLDPSLPISDRWIGSRLILDATIPYEWEDKPKEIFMDRGVMEKVSNRWEEYGFSIPDPIPELIDRLSKPKG
jgi:4-hydroxy-3-polyprenylbenzoate decarboxylase